MSDGAEQSECTNMDCSEEAVYGYWMPDLGHFSEVRSPEHDQLKDGDLAPYVCESCRDRMAAGPHWDADRFVDPRERLVADGGTFEDGTEQIEQYDKPLDALAHRLWIHWSQHIAEEEDISEDRLQRWRELWIPYGQLPEEAGETDRRLVQRYREEEPDYTER